MRGGAGALQERVTLQRRTETADGAGGVTRAWADLDPATVWAHVKARPGREGMAEGRVVATQITTFTVRNRDDVDETCRIVWNGETWNIRAVLREGPRRQLLALDAERGVAE